MSYYNRFGGQVKKTCSLTFLKTESCNHFSNFLNFSSTNWTFNFFTFPQFLCAGITTNLGKKDNVSYQYYFLT